MPGRDAAANMEQFMGYTELLPENIATSRSVMRLVGHSIASGKQIHDANIVAVALAHGARAIVTSDTRHFVRFSDAITIESLH